MGKVLYDQCLFYGYALDELTFFFSPLILWLLIIVSYTIFMIAKCFFAQSLAWDQGDIVSSQGLKIFLFATAMLETRQDTKKFHNYNDTFLFNFYNIGLENLVLDELTISLSMLFFIPTTFWLDFVRRNSVSVTHKSERVISHCNWTEITYRSKKSSISINNTPSLFWKILKQLV